MNTLRGGISTFVGAPGTLLGIPLWQPANVEKYDTLMRSLAELAPSTLTSWPVDRFRARGPFILPAIIRSAYRNDRAENFHRIDFSKKQFL